jgi:hypothetical protein
MQVTFSVVEKSTSCGDTLFLRWIIRLGIFPFTQSKIEEFPFRDREEFRQTVSDPEREVFFVSVGIARFVLGGKRAHLQQKKP